MEANQSNQATVAGTVASTPLISNCCGETFYSFILQIKRSSGIVDTLPVRASTYIVENINLGDQISLEGQIKTHQKFAGGRNHLIIIFLACEVRKYEKDINIVDLTGFLCTTPHHRITPLGRDICDLMVAVKNSQGRSDYIPCIVWDKRSKYAANLKVGTKLKLTGRFQSRSYTKVLSDGSSEERTAYELSVGTISEEK